MNLLAHKAGRSFSVFAFYFAEGVPIGFIWWAMPTLMRQNGVEIKTIGATTALLTLPWVFKFVWAPLVDIFRTASFGFTKWITASQCMMCLSLLPLMFFPLKENIETWTVCLFLHSMFAATQDVSVDALVINIVPENEKGLLNGYMQAGMLIGRSIFGGVILIFAQRMGMQLTVGLMIMAIISISLLMFFIKEPVFIYKQKKPFPVFRNRLWEAIKRKQTWLCILFALTAGAAFEAAGGFAGPLLTDAGVHQKSIGFFFALPVVAAMLIGGLAGGIISDKIGRKKSMLYFLGAIIASVISIATVSMAGTSLPAYVVESIYCVMYLFTGMFTAASYAFFMDATDPKLGATQFSTYMAATNGCEAIVVYFTGVISVAYGYGFAFLTMCLFSGVGILFLRTIRLKRN